MTLRGLGAVGMEHGAGEGRALRNDPVGHFSEGASLQGGQGAWSTGSLAKSEASRSCTFGCEAKDLKTLCNKSFFNSDN